MYLHSGTISKAYADAAKLSLNFCFALLQYKLFIYKSLIRNTRKNNNKNKTKDKTKDKKETKRKPPRFGIE